MEIAVSCTRAACPCRKSWTSPKKLPIATSSINCNQKWDAAGDDSAVIAVILLCKSWPWLRGGWGVGGGVGEVYDGGWMDPSSYWAFSLIIDDIEITW